MSQNKRFTLLVMSALVGSILIDPKPAAACEYMTSTEPQVAPWDVSETVYLARIERLQTFQAKYHSGRRGVLVPVDVLKGSGPVPNIALATRPNPTSCDTEPPALRPGVSNGDLFIVFSNDRGPNVTENVGMVRAETVDDPRVLSRLGLIALKASQDEGPGAELGWLGLLGLAGLIGLRNGRPRPGSHP